MIALYACFGILGLNGYAICVHRSSKDWMGTIYVSFEVVGFIWLLSMHPLEFQGLDSYYICVIWTFKGHDVLKIHQKPFCASTHGAQTLVGFCIHVWFNINIVVGCPWGKSTCQWWHVMEFLKNIPFDMEQIYLKYSFLHLFIDSCSCSHVHKIAIPINYLYL
jgi:hypothetical protein